MQREVRLIMGMDTMRFAALAPTGTAECSIEARNVPVRVYPSIRNADSNCRSGVLTPQCTGGLQEVNM
jgi:hypothetical protein